MTKIRVRLGQAEAEVESDPEHIREAIDLVPELASKLPGANGKAPDGAGPLHAERAVSYEGGGSSVPSVHLDKGDSLADVIGKFFAEPWGRERRKLSDVRDALQSYGLNYPKQSVAVALLRLAKTARLRRFKAEDGEFVYTSGGVMAVPPRPGDEEAWTSLAEPS
ncbi:MAG: hypothetical protein HY296_01050 [Thaumarchaeota archaeon]|nr:hypothetical protein [Nitrososphaerota archaeon]